jgi:hypothetical protein
LRDGIADGIKKGGEEGGKIVNQVGGGLILTVQKVGDDTITTLQKASGDTITTVQKAGGDTIMTVVKGANDVMATYEKGWRDTDREARSSLANAIEAGQAVEHYTRNQVEAQMVAVENATKRVSEGKVVDGMWSLAVEPAQATEKNFFKATQESAVINAAAQSAAAAYGGPAGAAAYASWATYRATGDANLALRAGILSAVTSQLGSKTASMPSGTSGELIKKVAISGAAGGIAVAAAGGDEQAVKDAFVKSGGAVLVQGGRDRLKAYSPKAEDSFKAVQCISAKDVDCLSNTTYVRNKMGKILYDNKGKPRIDSKKLDPKQYIGNWTGIDPKSPEGKKLAFITQISKLPKTEAIPLLKNKWVLTWTFGQTKSLEASKPAVVLTYVGQNAPFMSKVKYGRVSKSAQKGGRKTGQSQVAVKTASYTCPTKSFNRTVKVSASAGGCRAIYRKEGGVSQIIWQSHYHPNSCVGKAAAFVSHLASLGIRCSAK